MLSQCLSLSYCPNITNKVIKAKEIKNIYAGCLSLISLSNNNV